MEKRQHPAERNGRRDGQRKREPVEPDDRLPREGERDVDRQYTEADEGEPTATTRDEDEREGDGEGDRGHHVRRHRNDEAADLGPDVVAVRAAENSDGDLGARDGENPRSRCDREERGPRGRLDMARDAPRLQAASG